MELDPDESAARRKVLLIGLCAGSVDFDKWPELTAETLEAAGAAVVSELVAAGLDPIPCLLSTDGSAEAQVSKALLMQQPDVVLIGAGVRKDPDHLVLFERIINLVLEHAPAARIAFNSLPYDSLAAIQRWS